MLAGRGSFAPLSHPKSMIIQDLPHSLACAYIWIPCCLLRESIWTYLIENPNKNKQMNFGKFQFLFRAKSCMNVTNVPAFYANVHMDTGDTANTWIDSLQASFSGVQVKMLFCPTKVKLYKVIFEWKIWLIPEIF